MVNFRSTLVWEPSHKYFLHKNLYFLISYIVYCNFSCQKALRENYHILNLERQTSLLVESKKGVFDSGKDEE